MLKNKKNLIATILALTVLFSALSGITSFAANETTYPETMNETFEGYTNLALPGTIIGSSNTASGEIIYSPGNGANGSDYYLKCTQNASNYSTPTFSYSLTKGVTYDISFDVMYPSTVDGAANEGHNWQGLQVRTTDNLTTYQNANTITINGTAPNLIITKSTYWNDNANVWKHIEATFTPTSYDAKRIYLKFNKVAGTVFYLDNLSIKPHVEEVEFSAVSEITTTGWNGTDSVSATVTLTGYEDQGIRAYLALYDGNTLKSVVCKTEADIVDGVISISSDALASGSATRAAVFVFNENLVPLNGGDSIEAISES